MISVDYTRLDSLLQARGFSRRQLAILIGIKPETLAAAFTRHSRMKSSTLWTIADCLVVPARSLMDRSAYATEEAYQADLKVVEERRADYETMVEDARITEIRDLLRGMNRKGLEQAKMLVEILSRMPEFRKIEGDAVCKEEQL